MSHLRQFLCTAILLSSGRLMAEEYGSFVANPPAKSDLKTLSQTTKTDESSMVQLEGHVEKVCEKKACWMTLKDGESSVRVTFKDYSFFVGRALEGRKVLVEGKLVRQKRSVGEQKHFLKDAGANAEEIAKVKEPQVNWEFVASGVRALTGPKA